MPARRTLCLQIKNMDTDAVVSTMSVSGWMLVFPMPRSGLRENGPRSSGERPLVLGRAGPKDTGTLAFVFGGGQKTFTAGTEKYVLIGAKKYIDRFGLDMQPPPLIIGERGCYNTLFLKLLYVKT